jgi:hypothetical protein
VAFLITPSNGITRRQLSASKAILAKIRWYLLILTVRPVSNRMRECATTHGTVAGVANQVAMPFAVEQSAAKVYFRALLVS